MTSSTRSFSSRALGLGLIFALGALGGCGQTTCGTAHDAAVLPVDAAATDGAAIDAAAIDAARTDDDASVIEDDAAVEIDAAEDVDAASPVDAAMPIDAGSSARGATMVPLYSYPTDSAWTRLASACAAHPTVRVVAVINPASGPTPSAEPSYASHIPTLVASGAEVLGYVATGYASRDPSVIHHEIDLYRAQYPDLVGIFFDETAATTPGNEDYYRELVDYARSAGLPFTVGNPGTGIDLSYDGIFDMILVYESAGEVSLSTLSRYSGRVPDHFGIIPYAVGSLDPAYVASVTSRVGWVYLTNDDLPNPWDTLPPYFDELLGALE